MNVSVRTTAAADIVHELEAIAGADNVLSSLEERTFFSTDISREGEVAAAVVNVDAVATLRRVLRACTARGAVVVPRGGGFSYTGGYTPTDAGAVILDLRPMNAVVEINEDDMYVVVEVGCTWRNLYEALKAKGLRTPYYGPMSGFRATVGGALSQGSLFLGSTQYGLLSDSVLGLEVALADGTVVRTGSWGGEAGASPFVRQYGPDMTGAFLNDTGAMGVKTRAALKLIPFPPHQGYGSFAFDNHAGALAALSAIGRANLAAECYCWDPYFVRLMAGQSEGLKQDLRFLWNVVKAGSGLVDGLSAAARMALSGRRAFQGDTWLLHVTMDDVSAAGAAAKLKAVRALALARGGREIAPSAPRTMRGTPFIDFNTPERRIARRNLPVHGLCPHSRAASVTDAIYALIADRKAEMEAAGVACGVILFAVGQQIAVVEPLVYWEDEHNAVHDRVRETSDLRLQATVEASPAAALAMVLRDELKAIFRSHGCAHVQIARSYPWMATRSPETLALVTAFKDAVDPHRLMNRGALGYGAQTP